MDQNQKKRNPKMILGIVFGLAIALSAQFFIFKKPDLNKQMEMAAAELNKSCPTMLDQETRFDNVEVLPGNIFQYNYTLVNLNAADIDSELAVKELEPKLVNTVKTDVNLKEYRDNQTTLNYNYKDKEGKFLFKISVTPEKYK